MTMAGRKAIITGASKGIGLGIARHFAGLGASLAICSRSADEIGAVGDRLRATGAQVMSARCDVSERDQLEAFVGEAAAAMGGIDILVNCACHIPYPSPLEEYANEIFAMAMTSGVSSAFWVMKAAFPFLRTGGGRIVNFTSIGGLRGARGQAGYAAAKTGIIGLTRVAAAEWARFGITANCIAPMAMSDAWATYLDTLEPGANPFHAVGVHSNAFGRPGDPERDIAPAVAFLCSDDARFITGSILPVDGGLLDLE